MPNPIKGGAVGQTAAHGKLSITPGPQMLPFAPPTDADLDAIIQAVVVGVTGLPGDHVRPRWQPFPPKQPEPTTDWCAISITVSTPDAGPAIEFNPLGQGSTTYIRHEDIETLASFYGPNGQDFAARLRDGIAIPQNTERLAEASAVYVECGPIRQAADLVNQQWIRRQDMVVKFRRCVTRVYGIESLLIANIELMDDTTIDERIVVPPNATGAVT